mmetsp:Transcript_21762/g.16101  ORF Transcript_21762/g.16101 Transcript_21762/m.16101 type:complete len:155 (+) Transcript_21762:1326-1790(+)
MKMSLWKQMVRDNLRRVTGQAFGQDLESNFKVEIPEYQKFDLSHKEGEAEHEGEKKAPDSTKAKTVSFFDAKNIKESLLREYEEPSNSKQSSTRLGMKAAIVSKLKDVYQLESVKDVLEKGDDYFHKLELLDKKKYQFGSWVSFYLKLKTEKIN